LSANLVATNLALDGQATPIDGQVASLTSRNNFINFCAGKTITNGQQVTGGSCNPIPMGDIIPQANMPSCKFQFPENFGTIAANQPFTVRMRLNNLQAGTFTNAQKTYYMAPQFLNGNTLIGHTHVVIQQMGAFDDPAILDPKTFAFFKGVNTGQVNGVVTADVTAGLPAGNYRMASINTSANHTPAIAAVAQH
ncbi:14919_t:CDS:1, partial [Acaulospora colombiana]